MVSYSLGELYGNIRGKQIEIITVYMCVTYHANWNG